VMASHTDVRGYLTAPPSIMHRVRGALYLVSFVMKYFKTYFSHKINIRILPLYLVNEILPPCGLIFAILSLLVLCQQVSRNSELFFSTLINWKILVQILINLMPPIITFTLPISIAVGEIITLFRLGSDQEWTVLEASGLNKFARFSPFLFIGGLGFIIIMALNWNIAPKAIAVLKETRKSLLITDITSLIRPQILISEFPGLLLNVKAINQETGQWDRVLLLLKSENSAKLQLLAAKSGNIIPINNKLSSFEIKLSNGVFIDNLFSKKDHITSAFRENTIKVDPKKSQPPDFPVEALTSVQLATIDDLLLRLKNDRSGVRRFINDSETEILKRFGNSFACIFASMCALVLVNNLRGRTAKRSTLLLVTFSLLIIYYSSLTLGQTFALKGTKSLVEIVLLEYAIPLLVLVTTYLFSQNKSFLYYFNYKSLFFAKPTSKINSSNLIPSHKIMPTKGLPEINYGHYLIISEFVKSLFLSLIVLTTTILLFTLLDIAPAAAKNNIQLEFILGYLLRLIPQIFYSIAPFGILLAVAATGTTLARTGQLSILLYYSISPVKLILPIIIGTVIMSLGILFVSETILPLSNREQDNRYRIIKGKSTEETTIALDHQWVSNGNQEMIYGFRAIDEIGLKRRTALIIKLTNPNYYLDQVIYLNVMDKQSDNEQIGFRYRIGESGLAEFASLKESDLPTEIRNQEMMPERTYREASKMSIKQLQEYIFQVERTGLPTISLRMEKMQKIAFPFACITLLFLAFPICLLQLRRQYQSRFSIIAISILLALLFWGVLSAFEVAGKRGTLPIIVAAWSPHALFLALISSIHLKLFHH
jgi:lipopolysaccharide export LptBFGC system permease protein LptF